MPRGCDFLSDDGIPSTASEGVLPSALWVGRLLTHVRKPENLVVYLMFTAWMKFMGVAEYAPSITIG